MNELEGIIPPLVTLFNENKELDWEANRNLVEYLINQNVDGIFILGSLGEFTHLTVAERKKYVEFIVEVVAGRVPVLVGVGHTATGVTIELSKNAERAGADCLVVVTPYYWGLDRQAIVTYYQKVAEAVELPILIYNFPNLTGINVEVDLIKEIAIENENIIGIKDTIDSLTHIHSLVNQVKSVKDNFSVLVGFDHYLLSGLIAGADGMIGGSANFLPKLGVEIFKCFKSGDLGKAMKTQQRLNQLSSIYDLANPPIAVVKEAINLQTPLDVSTMVRGPALTIDSFVKNKLEELLVEFS